MDNEYKRDRNRTVLDLMSIDELRHEIHARMFGEKQAEIDALNKNAEYREQTIQQQADRLNRQQTKIDELVYMFERVRDCKDISQDEIEALIARNTGEQ